MTSSDVKVRIATKEDLRAASALTVEEGWDYPVDYLEAVFSVDPDGYHVVEKGGEIVGMGTAININDSLAFFAMGITKKGHRKQGIQRRLIEEGFKHTGDRNIGLSSLDERHKQVYAEIGFKLISYQTTCFRGLVNQAALLSESTIQSSKFKILPLSSVSFDSLVVYDTKAMSFKRENFLKAWCRGTGALTFVSINEGGELVGYINARPLTDGFAILPLIADSAEIAELLFNTLIHHLPAKSFVRLLTVMQNLAAVELAKKYNIQEVMYTLTGQFNKRVIPVKIYKIFSAASAETI